MSVDQTGVKEWKGAPKKAQGKQKGKKGRRKVTENWLKVKIINETGHEEKNPKVSPIIDKSISEPCEEPSPRAPLPCNDNQHPDLQPLGKKAKNWLFLILYGSVSRQPVLGLTPSSNWCAIRTWQLLATWHPDRRPGRHLCVMAGGGWGAGEGEGEAVLGADRCNPSSQQLEPLGQ